MRLTVFTFACVLAFTALAQAADDFGTPFANQTPAALSDDPYVEPQNPWDVEPAAGAEEDTTDVAPTQMDLPASDDAIEQLKTLDAEHSNIIVDDLSP